ncbi:hypothetical protein DP113_19750 [Brasilonema octagenarum UFV-E1]|uniref:Uncharacterized protein n=1 Tax=Brasilonema sennae CENA114 TaxID=415709 RepID=A0A856MES6_9CYAN|nr:hypothetical protein DP114_19825 [Brasilonema sennae CENA114]QDL16188.1 hypothetical protein DP113_19750 [Brasilonema octagenarum UFV-E1]
MQKKRIKCLLARILHLRLIRLELKFKANNPSPLKRTQKLTQSVLTDLDFEPRNLFIGGRKVWWKI